MKRGDGITVRLLGCRPFTGVVLLATDSFISVAQGAGCTVILRLDKEGRWRMGKAVAILETHEKPRLVL